MTKLTHIDKAMYLGTLAIAQHHLNALIVKTNASGTKVQLEETNDSLTKLYNKLADMSLDQLDIIIGH